MSLIPRLTRRVACSLAPLVLVAGLGIATSSSAQPEKPSSPPAATAEVENPYGLKAMVEHGDAVSKTVLALLAIMFDGRTRLGPSDPDRQCRGVAPAAAFP